MWDIFGKGVFLYLVLKFGFSCVKGIYSTILASILGLNAKLNKLGQWAVVTGATDGIGKAYAFEMARQGLNVVLISRTPFKLQNVASEITSKYKVQTKIIDVNFTATSIYDRIRNELASLDIGVLVNNVGMSQQHPDYYNVLNEELVLDLINCNIVSVTHMTKIVLEGMVKRKRGLIINVSSLSSLIPAPLLAVYGASKSFVVSFSKSLQLETQSNGITVQCVTPGFVATNMSRIKNPSLMAPTPMAYVKSSLKTTGVDMVTGGYHMHKLQIYVIEFVQKFLPDFILANVTYAQLSAIRTKALKKLERAAKEN